MHLFPPLIKNSMTNQGNIFTHLTASVAAAVTVAVAAAADIVKLILSRYFCQRVLNNLTVLHRVTFDMCFNL